MRSVSPQPIRLHEGATTAATTMVAAVVGINSPAVASVDAAMEAVAMADEGAMVARPREMSTSGASLADVKSASRNVTLRRSAGIASTPTTFPMSGTPMLP